MPLAGPGGSVSAATQSWPDFRNEFLQRHKHYLPAAPKAPAEAITGAWLRAQGRYFHARARAIARIRKAYLKMSRESHQGEGPVWFVSRIASGDIRTAVLRAFGSEGEHALAVLACENPEMNPAAIHYNGDGTSDWGLFQINIYYNRGNFDYPQHLLDPFYNIAVAANVYHQRGWHDWTCGRLLGLG
jgi:Lysozyme like domain